MTNVHQSLADLLFAARQFGFAELSTNEWRQSSTEQASAGKTLLAALRERAAQGDTSAREFLALHWAAQLDSRTAARGDEHAETAQIISEVIASLPNCPGGFSGRGIVTCAGGPTYQTCAWVLFSLLRKLGCTLPIECWYVGSGERDEAWQRWVGEEFGVSCVDAVARGYVGHRFAETTHFRHHAYSAGAMHGYALKPFALLHSSFREVLFLDADNTPERDPAFLFDSPEFRETGAIFWPDLADCALAPELAAFGVPDVPDPINWESGQIVLDKKRAWRALSLSNWFNAQAGYFYRYSWGDCGTWQAAWRRLAAPWSMPEIPARRAGEVALVQHDFAGAPLFFHRVGRRGKWRLTDNEPTPGYSHNRECFEALEELSRRVAG